MARPTVRDWVDTKCVYCEKPLRRVLTKKNRAFCSQSCYFSWLRESRPQDEIYYKYEQGELLAELQNVTNQLGHLPSTSEMRSLSHIGPDRYAARFGSWRMALTCINNPSSTDEWTIDHISDIEGGWLSGVADSESTFRIARNKSAFSPIWGLQVRADDLPMMLEIKRIMGIKHLFTFWHRDNDRKRGIDAGDAIRLYIRDIPTHVSRTLPIFTRFSLKSKKAVEFVLFKEAILLLHKHQQDLSTRKYSDQLKCRLAEIKTELEQLKKYHPITDS